MLAVVLWCSSKEKVSLQPTGHQESRMTIFCVIALSHSLKSNFYSLNCHISILVYSQSWSVDKKYTSACKFYITYLHICVQKDWEAVWSIWCQHFTLRCDTSYIATVFSLVRALLPFLQMLAHPLLCLASQAPIGMHRAEGVSCPACTPHHGQGTSLLSSITIPSAADPQQTPPCLSAFPAFQTQACREGITCA